MSDASLRPSTAAIIVAGGTGERFGDPGGKQLALAAGTPILVHTIRAFAACSLVAEIVAVVHADRILEFKGAFEAHGISDANIAVVAGGESRQHSVANGLAALSGSHEIVVVHDGARPLVTEATITSAIASVSLGDCDGVVVGHPSFDTLKRVDGNRITDTPDRSHFWVAQTPQVFRYQTLQTAHTKALEDGYRGTDDASLVERNGGDVRMIEGPRDNIKVTVPEDILFVEAVLRSREDSGVKA